MPQSVLSLERVLSLLPKRPDDSTLTEALFESKAEESAREGDALTIEVTPDRIDLLSEGGLGLYLQGALELVLGLPKLVVHSALPAAEIRVDPSVESVRPSIAGVLVSAPTESGVDEGTLAEAIRFQEQIHATTGRDRRAASLGIYPWDRISPPISYSLEPIDSVRFVPLGDSEERSGRWFFENHPLAQRYGAWARSKDQCLTLRDLRGEVLSLPPVLNSRAAGEARPGDRVLLLESTGTRASRVQESLALLLLVFAARNYSVFPVAVRGASGIEAGTPVFATRRIHLPGNLTQEISGLDLKAGEIEHLLARARLGVHPEAGGWGVEVPAWRPDLLTASDLTEEAILLRGVRPSEGILPPCTTRGRRRPESHFRHSVEDSLLGLGFSMLYTPVLVSGESVALLGRSASIRIANAASEQFSYLRDSLVLSLADVLGRNLRQGYPQRFAEVGPVLRRDPQAEGGASTRFHAGAFLASDTAGFADGAALVDYLLHRLDVLGVRAPAELPGTIPGRAARVRIAGDVVAELGEIHPEVLTARRVPVPVVWAELDLSALWTLVRRAATD